MPSLRTLLLSFILLVAGTHTPPCKTNTLWCSFLKAPAHYCHKSAPKITRLSERFQLPVYAFSVDGAGIPGFEVPIPVTPEIAALFSQTMAKPSCPPPS